MDPGPVCSMAHDGVRGIGRNRVRMGIDRQACSIGIGRMIELGRTRLPRCDFARLGQAAVPPSACATGTGTIVWAAEFVNSDGAGLTALCRTRLDPRVDLVGSPPAGALGQVHRAWEIRRVDQPVNVRTRTADFPCDLSDRQQAQFSNRSHWTVSLNVRR